MFPLQVKHDFILKKAKIQHNNVYIFIKKVEMEQKMKRRNLGLPLLLTSLFVLGACTPSTPKPTPVVVDRITSIQINKEPDKVNYYVGDSVNFEGIEIQANYSSGAKKEVSLDDCSIIGATTISKGDHQVYIEYEGFSVSFTIYVTEKASTRVLNTVDVDVLPNKVNYLPGESFDAEGMVANAKYSDGTLEDVTDLAAIEITENGNNPADMSKVGVKTVKVKYDNKFDTFDIYVRESEGLDDSVFGDNTEGHGFSNLVNSVLTNHNYVVNLTSYIAYHTEETHTSVYTNLNNKAYYNYDADNQIYGGLLYQKDQGFVIFRQASDTGNISLGSFYSTSLTHMISDIYDVVIENVLNAKWVQDNDNHARFSTTDYYSIATGCNFTGYADSANLEAPENILAEYIDSTHFNLYINFVVIYYDAETGQMVQEPGLCLLEVAVGSASNIYLEQYIQEPTYIYPTPTGWSDTDKAYFNAIYGIVPPFVQGASYSFYFDEESDYRGNYLFVTDYASGDIRETYRTQLKTAHYVQVGNDVNHYRYVVEKGLRVFNYDVYLTYRLPTASYNGKTYGFYYPNGEMYIEYIKTETNSVNTVARYNKFVQDFVGSGVLPEVPFGDEVTNVSNFVYSTNTDVYKFYQGNFTKFHIESYSKAVEDMTAYLALLAEYGYTEVIYNSVMKVYNCFRPGKSSYVSITPLDQIAESDYTGILEIRCQLYAQDYQEENL